MFARLVSLSLTRGRKRRVAIAASVALGAGAATGLLILFLGVGDRVMQELRSYGANILVTPAVDRLAGEGKGSLLEEDLPRVWEHFWKRAIVAAAPLLPFEAEVDGVKRTVVGIWGARELGDLEGGHLPAGHAPLMKGWVIQGEWPSGEGALAGVRLDKAVGDTIHLAGRPLPVVGVVSTGGEEDDQVFVDLALAQRITGEPGRIKRVLVSAVVAPETRAADLLSARYRRDPRSLTPRELESLSCTNTPIGVALSIERAWPGSEARPLRQATETETRILARVRGAFLLLAGLAVVASCLSVLAAMTAGVVDRRKEIGLLKALGATDAQLAAFLLTEGAVLAVIGSGVGYALGLLSARLISVAVFGRPMTGTPAVYALTLASALGIVVVGTLAPLRSMLRLQPREVLHEV